jgi:hypothetical protein
MLILLNFLLYIESSAAKKERSDYSISMYISLLYYGVLRFAPFWCEKIEENF